jgi:putative hemolysin
VRFHGSGRTDLSLHVFAALPLFAIAAGEEPSTARVVIGLVAIPVLVALNGFFVAAEFALVAIRRTRVDEMVNQGKVGAKAVADAVTHLDRTIAATQLGITLASIALGFVAEPALAAVLDPALGFLPDRIAFFSRHALAVFLAFSLVTFLHVVFGELMPKAVALQAPDKTALVIAPPLNVFSRASRLVVYLMNGTGNWLLKKIGFTPSGTEGHVHSVEELRMLVEDTQEAGLIEDCMVPQEQVVGLDVNTPPDKVLEVARLGAHTRMPVYKDTPDNIVGIVNTKDLFFLFSTSGLVVLEDAMYPATFLDPDEPVANAFKLFQKSHRPMAVVRDGGGKVRGVITIEDVLEEIVGDMEDEHDVPVPKLKRVRIRPGVRASGLHTRLGAPPKPPARPPGDRPPRP